MFVVSLSLDEDRVHVIATTITAATTSIAIIIASAAPPITAGTSGRAFALLSSSSASVMGRKGEIIPSHAALGFLEIGSLK